MRCRWLSPPHELSLAADRVHLWRLSQDLPEDEIARLATYLAPEERERAERFHFARDRDRFIAMRSLLRIILANYLRISPSSVIFDYGPEGKPELANAQVGGRLKFNLSHSNRLALLAVTQERRVGVDLEYIRPLQDAAQIAQRFFAPGECAAYLALPPAEQPAAFFRCWTCKEAYIKAIGRGLSYPLDRFEVSVAPNEPARLLSVEGDADQAALWSMKVLQPEPDYLAALVVEGHDWHLSCWQSQKIST